MTDIAQLLGKDADSLLQHRCMTIPADQLYLPGHDYVDRVMVDNNRPPAVLRNMQTLYNTGRLGGTGYLYSAGRPGRGALGGRLFCGQPALLRSEEHC
jgi:class I fructose-bisphosphate aldolase